MYESITELFGTCEHLPVLEAIVHTSTTCTDPALGISYHVPAGWDIRLNQSGDFSTSLASFDLSNPPHKLEWNESSVQIDLKQLDPAPSSVENWVETAKEAYHVDGVSLWIYEQETRILETSCTLERLTLVSGSGGMLHLIYLSAGKKHLEIQVQGSFELAVPVFNSIQECIP